MSLVLGNIHLVALDIWLLVFESQAMTTHQTSQVPKIEVLTHISCVCKAYVRENPPQNSLIWFSTSIFGYLKLLVMIGYVVRVGCFEKPLKPP